MAEIERIDAKAAKYLREIGKEELWTLAYDGGYRHGMLTTNISESFNNAIKGVRNLPIRAAVELVFTRIVKMFQDKKEDALHCQHPLPKRPWKIYREAEIKGRKHSAVQFSLSDGIFNILTHIDESGKGGNTQTVCMKERSCTCGKWMITRIPCSHAMLACRMMSINPITLVGQEYHKNLYLKTCSGQFHPIQHEDYWPGQPFSLVGDMTRMRPPHQGRTSTARIHNEMDEREDDAPRCRTCHLPGHNRKNCPRLSSNQSRLSYNQS